MAEKLTIKQSKFAESVANKEYDFIWEAYAVHYSTSNMSQNTIYQESCRLLANRKISARILELEEEIAAKSEATLNEILVAMSQRVRLDMREFYDEDGSLRQPHELSKEQAMCIQDWDTKVFKDGATKITKIKLIDLKGLWDMFLKKNNQYTNNVNISTEEDLSHIREVLGDIEE